MRKSKANRMSPIFQIKTTGKWVKFIIPKRFFPTDLATSGSSGSKDAHTWLRGKRPDTKDAVGKHTKCNWVFAIPA